jgi:hypothetical protein
MIDTCGTCPRQIEGENFGVLYSFCFQLVVDAEQG